MTITIDKSEHPAIIVADGSDGQVHIFNQFMSPWCAEDGETYDDPESEAPGYEGESEQIADGDMWCRACLNSGLEEGVVIES